MFELKRAHLVQFFLFPAQTLELDRTTAIIAPNGAGKSALLDALQIVMLGGDRSQIRFNAQAGGSARARTIRDYCLGVFRAGEDGRARDTATTFISLVFTDTISGDTLTAGVALGASATEPDHRLHGMYLLPGVALTLDDHLEVVGDDELPLEWPRFRERIAALCKAAGTKAELHQQSERFLKDFLQRLRPASAATLDPGAYRKAFQNALNLQRVNDVDLFVRTLVAEDRPTEIAKFRALLEGFRQIREKVEQVALRIAAAEAVEAHYRRLAQAATRGASYRALGAEYRRDLHFDRVDAAEQAQAAAHAAARALDLRLHEARSERETAQHAAEAAAQRLHGTAGYGERASFEAAAKPHRDELVRLKKELLRGAAFVRDQLETAAKLPLHEAEGADAALAPWRDFHAAVAALAADAELPAAPDVLHTQLAQALRQAAPLVGAVVAHERTQQAALDQARQRARDAKHAAQRADAGQAELRADVVRLMHYLRDEGVPAQPVCDLVRVTDPAWQRAIEAYLRSHVEALLIPAEYEERAVRLYRSLQGNRSVYGVKLALASQARAQRAVTGDNLVAGLLASDNADALAYLQRQLGDLRCVETEAEVVASRHGLTRDGMMAKGGGVERLRLPAAAELKIGANSGRDRAKVLRQDIEAAEAQVRRLEQAVRPLAMAAAGAARLAAPDELLAATHALLIEHRAVAARLREVQEGHAARTDPDLVRLTEQEAQAREQVRALEKTIEQLIGRVALAHKASADADAELEQLNRTSEDVAREASLAFAHADVDPDLVEQLRRQVEERAADLAGRLARCEQRSRECEADVARAVPEAWSGLAQYSKDHGLPLTLEPADWRAAQTLLARELAHLKGTELVQHQQAADDAYATAVETFRASVASTLYDNFTRLKQQIATLNRTLQRSPKFSNDERYQFRYEVASEFRDLHRFIVKAAEAGAEDNLFGSAGEVPAAFRDLIEERAGGKSPAPSPLDDYRRFFSFEVVIKQDERVIGTLSERMRSGSGGEHRAPLYVIAGAALAAAYGKAEGQQGGLGVIMLDEFGDKIDAQNARATTSYLRSLGLQLILAAPDTAQGTLSGVLDSYIELFRDGALLQLERIEVTDRGRLLLASDEFRQHPELLQREIERLRAEQAAT